MTATRMMIRGAALGLVMILAACSSGKGGYYSSDGPPRSPPSNLDAVPDAVPRIEPLASGPNRPYRVMGNSYTPDTSGRAYRKRGMASWYGKKFHGNPTSNGERYDMYAMTAAHTTLPIPSYARVTRVATGRTIIVRINDRGPFLHNRVIDLSYVAAHKLDILGPGSAEVIVERITPEEIRTGSWRRGSQSVAVTQETWSYEAAEPPQRRITISPATSNPSNSTSFGARTGATFLQIGAFQDESNARSLANRAAGTIPGQMTVEVDQSTPSIYRVRVGPYPNREAALGAIDPIYQSLGIMPSISAR